MRRVKIDVIVNASSGAGDSAEVQQRLAEAFKAIGVDARISLERDFLAFATKDVRIGTPHKRVRVALDGEVTIMEPPLHYRVRPGALRVAGACQRSGTLASEVESSRA